MEKFSNVAKNKVKDLEALGYTIFLKTEGFVKMRREDPVYGKDRDRYCSVDKFGKVDWHSFNQDFVTAVFDIMKDDCWVELKEEYLCELMLAHKELPQCQK